MGQAHAFIVSLILVTSALSAAPLTIGNRAVSRQIEVEDGALRTTRIVNQITKNALVVGGDEFRIGLMDGTALTAGDFHVVGEPRSRSTREGKQWEIRLQTDRAPVTAIVRFSAPAKSPWVHKWLELSSDSDDGPVVDFIEVESLQLEAVGEHGGRGQPVYVAGEVFFGLEYPGGHNSFEDGVLSLSHFPGRALSKTPLVSKRAALGVGPAEDVRHTFRDYVDAIRLPPRSFLHYNSWYDIRRNDMSTERFVRTFDDFQRNLLEPYGLRLAALVPDDGWQDFQSIWQVDKAVLPEGWGPLGRYLRDQGSALGLWMPLNGTNLDQKWGSEEGYEVATSGGYYCMSAPKYNARLREVIRQRVEEGNLAYFKHDFNWYRCHEEGHGHLPTDRHSFEANLDAELGLLAYERELQPDIFLNVTSGMWLSPWWLQHADTIWMAAADFGYIKSVPAFEPRQWAMTYRDGHLYRRLGIEDAQFPLSALMTCGLIYGKLCQLGGKEEAFQDWADNCVLHVARGLMLKELYVTPEIMSEQQWEALGRALQWAEGHTETFVHSHMILGDPAKGEAYGFAAYGSDPPRGVISVRNPSIRPARVAVPLEYREMDVDSGRRLAAELVYPYRRTVATDLGDRDALELDLASWELMVLEVRPLAELGPEAVQTGSKRYAVVERDEKTVRLRTFSTDGPGAEVEQGRYKAEEGGGAFIARVTLPADAQAGELVLLQEGASRVSRPAEIKINGEAVEARPVEGEAWAASRVPLQPRELQAISARWEVSAREPFQRRDFVLSAYALWKRPLQSELVRVRSSAVGRRLPLEVHPDIERHTEIVLEPERVEVGEGLEGMVTEAELRQAKAAKLRIETFGAQGGEYEHKPMRLNGVELGNLPANRKPWDAWQEHIIDLPAEALKALRLDNEFAVTDETGDCFKVRGLAVAVQLPNGSWRETRYVDDVFCSVASWLHGEGKTMGPGEWEGIGIGFGSAE